VDLPIAATVTHSSSFDIPCSIFDILSRHCEERSAVAISKPATRNEFTLPALERRSRGSEIEEPVPRQPFRGQNALKLTP